MREWTLKGQVSPKENKNGVVAINSFRVMNETPGKRFLCLDESRLGGEEQFDLSISWSKKKMGRCLGFLLPYLALTLVCR